MARAILVGFVAAMIAGCGPSYKKLKVDQLQTVVVTTDDPAQTFCAYAPVALRALVTYRNGEQARSRVPGEDSKGRLRASEFQWSSNHGTVDAEAVLKLPLDALTWYDEAIAVSARVIARPEFVGEGVVRPRFDCGGTLDLRGSVGPRGGEAEDGGPGAPGPVVEVALAYIDTERSGRLVLVRVQRGDDVPEHYLVDADGSQKPFVIDARGGAGGRGGQGMAGVDGRAGDNAHDTRDANACAAGVPGQPGTDAQPGSPGGPGRNGSQGGPGGRVLVQHDGRFPELLALIQVRVEGGEAGEAGPGGPGGRGGSGGQGAAACNGSDVSAGARGADGAQGPSGAEGRAGSSGPHGELEQAAVDVLALFADEIARGMPIATGAGASP